MKITINRQNEDYLFEAKNQKGSTILIDNTGMPDSKGLSPMELVASGVAGCSAIDIISILKKQRQEIKAYRTEVNAERTQNERPPNFFKKISVSVFLEGNIEPKKALRAAELSFNVYCSVSKTLEKAGATIVYTIFLNGKKL